ncbi:MAG: flagellar filament capping protein FliD [Bdellovibrionales bacterium]|nr:flagellar filament capping protein FliD [Bdellovibrionales bacterium]
MALISFSGLASGIDSAALIDALIDRQRQARIVPFENQITTFQETNSALEDLSSLLTNLKDAAEKFRVVNGGALSKSASSSDETRVSASASNSAKTGSYSLNVLQLASNATFSFNDRFASTDSALNSSINDGAPAGDRTVSFTLGNGASADAVDIELTSSTTASDFVNDFNSQTDKATASLVNVGTESSPSYAIVITSNSEGTDDGSITLDSVGSEVLTAGSGAFGSYELDQAEDLLFTVDGISGTFTRSGNTVNDVIDGLTFTAEGIGSAKISITADSSNTEAKVQEFVDAYNEIVEFIKENDLVTQEQNGEDITNIFGALSGTSLDENVLSSIRSAFSSSSLSGELVNTLADLGVTTERDGTLSFDSDTFQQALSDDSNAVGTILGNLGETLGGVSGTIAQFTRYNGLFDQAISSNSTQVTSLQDQIGELEKGLSEQRSALESRFARLEAQIGQLQNTQSSLASILSGIG